MTTSTFACGHTLDLLITRLGLLPSNINVDVPVMSDHGLIIYCLYCLPLPRPASATKLSKMIRRLREIDHDVFNSSELQSSISANIESLTDCSNANLSDLNHSELRYIVYVMAPPVNVIVSFRSSTP